MATLGILAHESVPIGATNVTVYVQLALTSGAPATGLVYNSGGLAAYTFRVDAGAQAISLATQTPTGAWATGGFCEVNSSTAPGLYRLDVPNARWATGASQVGLAVTGTGLTPFVTTRWLVPVSRVFATVGSSPTRQLIRLSGPTLADGQLLRRQLQVLTGAAANERVTIVDCATNGDVMVSPPFTVAPTASDRVVVL
jgi:hypothetical protein